MAKVLISRDSFARTELVRTIYARKGTTQQGCTCCGVKGQTLFNYATESDGGRTFPHAGHFCGASCFHAYNG